MATKEYGWRKIKFHDPAVYEQFLNLAHDRGSDITKECNLMIKTAVSKQRLLSESAIVLEEV